MQNILERLQESSEVGATDLWYELGVTQPAMTAALEKLAKQDPVRRIWARDGKLWSTSGVMPNAAMVADIEHRLGWLDLPQEMRVHVVRLKALAEEVKAVDMTHVVLLGMGGSSLAPEVLSEILAAEENEGGLALTVLDSTDPAQILHVQEQAPLAQTLFIVSSKSGTTSETMSLYAYFRHVMTQEVGAKRWARHFVAITDPKTPLAKLAEEQKFRAVYLNPPDVGGRYSALSLVGLVPAALMGLDLDRLLLSGKEMAQACKRRTRRTGGDDILGNPGIVLGAILGGLARNPAPGTSGQKRDKLILLSSPELRAFGAWVEQLIAESTGKFHTGLVPVVVEEMLDDDNALFQGNDRQFVIMRLHEGDNEALDARVAKLVEMGQPVTVIPLADRYDLGAAFFLWEFATAVAGLVLEINPFDQPNVEAAKRQARQALQQYERNQSLPELEPILKDAGADGVTYNVFGPDLGGQDLQSYLRAFLQQIQPGAYIALMAYLQRNATHQAQLSELAHLLTEWLGVPATVGFGPRFLHSTGQLHKGGPQDGLFVQITHDDAQDVDIPDHAYSFGVLKRAQAIGDFQALQERKRPIIRLHMGPDVEAGLRRLIEIVSGATGADGG
jgi:glucose-6-phosphate isomerase